MQYNPHDYQKYAITYIEDHPIAAVLLDMGLGKTSITLTALDDLLFDSVVIFFSEGVPVFSSVRSKDSTIFLST